MFPEYEEEEEDEMNYIRERSYCFFSENCFICSRDDGYGNLSVEIHVIRSNECSLFKKVELQSKHPFDRNPLFVESLETHIIFFNKENNEVTTRIEREPVPDTSNLPPKTRLVHYYNDGELNRAVKRVIQKFKNQKKSFGHVRYGELREDGTDKWKSYVSMIL